MQGDSYLDVAQVTLYVFWVFFLGLILYLRREDKREGYPLVSDTGRGRPVHGFFPQEPDPKSYLLRTGHVAVLPNHGNDRPDVASAQATPWPGSPFAPTGNAMLDGVGPGSWANREDVPEFTMDNIPAIAPLRLTPATSLEARDADPRGMKVIGCDREVGGVVVDVWIDRAELLVRYLEVEVPGKPAGPVAVRSDGVVAASTSKRVLLPMPFCLINKPSGYVSVHAILGHQFADVPVTAHPDQVTKREEDRIAGYYGGGLLYATPARQEPLL
ncbi:photosynthetic reaction center subunit H [Tardiphaga sp. vice154]|uniref:photosynthetic reaction center subunit H n=1 Tax=unclassified Tardiphaga TaxID=2631404 RepID=UPI0011655CFD|nr:MULTISPECIES: photosynthetic reaction center subunit H [unclassified Tardiphaga]MBC7584834.1 photosynthetic reaction center subunit H [Tardiphaga sp.]QDM20744.1 photosynthetic reaction center subunit H [Tardiphaga sp. vice154]